MQAPAEPKTTVFLRVDPGLHAELRRAAFASRKSLTAVATEALRNYLAVAPSK